MSRVPQAVESIRLNIGLPVAKRSEADSEYYVDMEDDMRLASH